MHISAAAAASGLPPKTIRYYEDIGLIAAARKRGNGYRDYDDRDVHILRFLQRARSLGFAVADCRDLLSLYADAGRNSADVKLVTLRHIADIDTKIAALRSMRTTLGELAERCHGDDRPDCPILDDLAAPAQ